MREHSKFEGFYPHHGLKACVREDNDDFEHMILNYKLHPDWIAVQIESNGRSFYIRGWAYGSDNWEPYNNRSNKYKITDNKFRSQKAFLTEAYTFLINVHSQGIMG